MDCKHAPSQAISRIKVTYFLMSRRRRHSGVGRIRTGLGREGMLLLGTMDPVLCQEDNLTVILSCIHSVIQPAF